MIGIWSDWATLCPAHRHSPDAPYFPLKVDILIFRLSCISLLSLELKNPELIRTLHLHYRYSLLPHLPYLPICFALFSKSILSAIMLHVQSYSTHTHLFLEYLENLERCTSGRYSMNHLRNNVYSGNVSSHYTLEQSCVMTMLNTIRMNLIYCLHSECTTRIFFFRGREQH